MNTFSNITAKEWILSMDINKLCNCYFNDYVKNDINFFMKKRKKTEKEIIEQFPAVFNEIINNIKNTVPDDTGKDDVLFPIYYYTPETDENYDLIDKMTIEYDVTTIGKEEIKKFKHVNKISNYNDYSKEHKCPEGYALMFLYWERLLGEELAFIPEEEDFNYGACAYFIHELTWFGKDADTYRKNVDKESAILEGRIKKLEENKEEGKDIYYTMDELRKELGLPDVNEEEEKKKRKIEEIIQHKSIVLSHNAYADIVNKYIIGEKKLTKIL